VEEVFDGSQMGDRVTPKVALERRNSGRPERARGHGEVLGG
jgi:hypothetical protein